MNKNKHKLEIKKILKRHRNHQDGMSPFSYLNPNAGDVEKGTEFFNHAASSEGSASPSVSMGMSESLLEENELIKKKNIFNQIKNINPNAKYKNYESMSVDEMLAILNSYKNKNKKKKSVEKDNNSIKIPTEKDVYFNKSTDTFMVKGYDIEFETEREALSFVRNLINGNKSMKKVKTRKQVLEALNKLDKKAIDEGTHFYDLRSLYEGLEDRLSSKDRNALKTMLNSSQVTGEDVMAVMDARLKEDMEIDEPLDELYDDDAFIDYDKNEREYKVSAYYEESLRGLEDDLYTDSYDEALDFVWDKCQEGLWVEILDTETGNSEVYSPDKFDETTTDPSELKNESLLIYGGKEVDDGNYDYFNVSDEYGVIGEYPTYEEAKQNCKEGCTINGVIQYGADGYEETPLTEALNESASDDVTDVPFTILYDIYVDVPFSLTDDEEYYGVGDDWKDYFYNEDFEYDYALDEAKDCVNKIKNKLSEKYKGFDVSFDDYDLEKPEIYYYINLYIPNSYDKDEVVSAFQNEVLQYKSIIDDFEAVVGWEPATRWEPGEAITDFIDIEFYVEDAWADEN